MPETRRSHPASTSTIWRRLPALNVATLCNALKPYRALTNESCNLGVFLDIHLVSTGLELLQACVREDVGERLLSADKHIVEKAMHMCVRSTFVQTKHSYDEIVARAGAFVEIPSRYYLVERIRSLRCAFLQQVGENFVHAHHGQPQHPRMWDAEEWKVYLYANPTEVFRITTLAIIQHAAKLDPTITTPSIHRLFPSFFPPFSFPHERWDQQIQTWDPDDPADSWKKET